MRINVKTKKLSKKLLLQIKEHLEKGGLLFYPTETVYGLGCDAFNREAINKIYRRKNRPRDQPMAVIVRDLAQVQEIAELNPLAEKLSKKFHPGPIVIALPKKKVIPDILNRKAIAFRISSHPLVQQILGEFQRPLVSTSANRTGMPSPLSVGEILSQITVDEKDVILDVGKLPQRKPSTLVDFQLQPSPQIIREGEISARAVLATLEIPPEHWAEHMQFLKR